MASLGLVDTSFIYAVAEAPDRHHAEAREFYRVRQSSFLMPTIVWPELAFHVNKSGGNEAVAQVIINIRQSAMKLIDLEAQDYDRAAEILRQYHDSRIDFVDASIMALAERLNIARILTYDRRDSSMYRPSHVEALPLLP